LILDIPFLSKKIYNINGKAVIIFG